MWVITDGKVRVETTADEGGETIDLGTLGVTDFFGENAVLTEESPSVPLKRMRSVYAITQLVQTVALTYKDLCQLRLESETIDAAVNREAEGLKAVCSPSWLACSCLRTCPFCSNRPLGITLASRVDSTEHVSREGRSTRATGRCAVCGDESKLRGVARASRRDPSDTECSLDSDPSATTIIHQENTRDRTDWPISRQQI